jgi:hypothetical protein
MNQIREIWMRDGHSCRIEGSLQAQLLVMLLVAKQIPAAVMLPMK